MTTRFTISNPGDRPVPFQKDVPFRMKIGDSVLHVNTEQNQDFVVASVRYIIDDIDDEFVQLVHLEDDLSRD